MAGSSTQNTVDTCWCMILKKAIFFVHDGAMAIVQSVSTSRAAAWHLRSYLHDQLVDFFIRTSSRAYGIFPRSKSKALFGRYLVLLALHDATNKAQTRPLIHDSWLRQSTAARHAGRAGSS